MPEVVKEIVSFNSNNWAAISYLEAWKIPNYDLMFIMIRNNIQKNIDSIMPTDAVVQWEKSGTRKWYDSDERARGLLALLGGLVAGWFSIVSPMIDVLNNES